MLCEKPISLTVPEAISLLHARDRTGVKIEEAFMVRTHPQWCKAVDLVRRGKLERSDRWEVISAISIETRRIYATFWNTVAER